MEHNKLCSLHGGSMSKFPCQMCSTTRDNLDNPAAVPLWKMTNGNKMRDLQNQPLTMKSIGYYPCKGNILYKLQYCDPGRLNHPLPPDTLNFAGLFHLFD